MGAERDFLGRAVTEFECGRPTLYFLPSCTACGREEKVRTNTRKMAPEVIRRHLQHKGWHVGQRVLCPGCVAAKRARPDADPEGDPIVTIATATKPVHPAPPLRVDPVAAVAPPRDPDPAERRRVREALFDAYDEDRARYHGVGSDDGLAAALDVPRAWVSDLRESMGLGPDTCEAADAFDKELRAIDKELGQISSDVLTRIGGIETRVRKLEIDRAYAPKLAKAA